MHSKRSISRLLIANRGEIAVRIAQAAAEMSISCVAVYPVDDANSLHVVNADDAVQLPGSGAAAYLDIEQIVTAARISGCDAIHPGYGFLSENAELALRCAEEGITFIGPSAELLQLFGDKLRAREVAASAGVPVLPASQGAVDAKTAVAFFDALDAGKAMIIKAVGGGGGRGMRIIRTREEIDTALARCAAEAESAFGNGTLYVEALVERARHIEVQIVADENGAVSHLFERDCSIQRRHQKLMEIAPAPGLPEGLRQKIHQAAVDIATAAGYQNIGTFEFLVDSTQLDDSSPFYFIEANPRLQVEHTITEEVTGVDLVCTQIEIAAGKTLADLRLRQADLAEPRGYAIQARINMEKMSAKGQPLPSVGLLGVFEPPHGPGVRVDTYGYMGYRTSSLYDSLLAKVIVHSKRPHYGEAVARLRRALSDFRIEGVSTNIDMLLNIASREDFATGNIYTRYIDDNVADLVRRRETVRKQPEREQAPKDTQAKLTGARVGSSDPLAILDYGREQPAADAQGVIEEGALVSAMQSTIVSVSVKVGDEIHRDQELLVLNAMKMEHVLTAPSSGQVTAVHVSTGDTVPQGFVLLAIKVADVETEIEAQVEELDLETPRPDLAEVLRRRALTTDASRRKQTDKRHQRGGRTARENVDDLCDEDSFVQFGSLAVGMSLEGTVDDLLDYAPSDGMVMGLGHVNGTHFDDTRSRCAVLAYDYSVLAGTQGGMNHKMMDRMLQVAIKLETPVVLFSEGGGGRAGGGSRAARGGGGGIVGGGGLNTPSWWMLGQLSGRVPIIGINSGWCFAGNAALLGCCDVIIATENSSIGMGGPAMIEGGGLGVYAPAEVGPMSVQVPNGVVDIAVKDEAEAVAAAKKYLSYFQGPVPQWACADQRRLRHSIPENRLRVYDIRELIETMVDADSVLELRAGFGKAMITSFARLQGRPVGIIANNPAFLSGAIDSDAADKAARFMKLCDAFDIPLVLLCDTPGIMVGPEAEKEATVRHSARMFIVGASLTVPTFMVILRKAYGLGAQAMGGGCHRVPAFVVAWPTSEFGGMGLEGQVKLGQRARLEAIADPAERQAAFEKMVEAAYDRGKGLNAAHVYEIEDVIDPADTRRWLVAGLRASPPPKPRTERKRPCVDTW